jgi:hypothetical protein
MSRIEPKQLSMPCDMGGFGFRIPISSDGIEKA